MRTLIATAILMLGGWSYAHDGHAHHSEPAPEATKAHLEFSGGAIHAHVTWEAGPELATENSFKIEWKNGADHTAIQPNKSFEVVLWMPDMNHGSSPTKIEPYLNGHGHPETGVYRVSNVYFIMGGRWQVNVILEGDDGSKETQTMEYMIPEGDSDHGHHHH